MKRERRFIYLLRVLAAGCITNSHFSNVWPVSGIASGGMLGDVLFFAISGYCLYQNDYRISNFGKWYAKRIKRIYITVVLVTLLTSLYTGFPRTAPEWVSKFIYPTQYHFIASIMVLYIVYYIWLCVLQKFEISVWLSSVVLIFFILVIYVFIFDKTWYHIDVVEDHFIRMLFFASMMLGAYFKEREEKMNNLRAENIRKTTIMCLASIAIYFAIRLVVPRLELYAVQIATWFAILFALYWIFRWGKSLEPVLQHAPDVINHILKFVSKITLQIYLVQYLIIGKFEALVFPINLLMIVVGIMVVAGIVWYIDQKILRGLDKLIWNKK